MKYKERPVVVYFESVNNIKVYKTVKSAMAETTEYNYQQLAKRLRETKIVPVDNGFLKMVNVLWSQRSAKFVGIPSPLPTPPRKWYAVQYAQWRTPSSRNKSNGERRRRSAKMHLKPTRIGSGRYKRNSTVTSGYGIKTSLASVVESL